MLLKFKIPEDYHQLNEYVNPYKVKLINKDEFEFPYMMHPYVTKSKSPFCYVLATCSSGTLGNHKKAKRSKNVLDSIQTYFLVYSTYYFRTNSIDFFFLKINGFSKIFRFIKKKMMFQFKDAIFHFKKLYKKIQKLNKKIKTIKTTHSNFPKYMLSVIKALTDPRLTDKPITVTDEEMNSIMNQPKEIDNANFNEKQSKLVKFTSRMLYFLSKFPKFIYIMDNTNYPFNGCKRVRHYK